MLSEFWPVPSSTNWYHFMIHHLITQLRQLDNFSFYDSFDESHAVYLVYFFGFLSNDIFLFWTADIPWPLFTCTVLRKLASIHVSYLDSIVKMHFSSFFQTFVWERHREKVPSVEGNTGWGLMGPKITIPKNYNTKERVQESQCTKERVIQWGRTIRG